MKITKRQLNKIIEEEIINTLEEVLTDEDVANLDNPPFEGAGMLDAPSSEITMEINALQAELKQYLQDPTVPVEVKKSKAKNVADRIEKLERSGLAARL